MKKIFKNSALIALGLVIGVSFSSFASNQTITAVKDNTTSIFIKGNELSTSMENAPISYNGRLYVPLRIILENMNFKVKYDTASNSVFISENAKTEQEKQDEYNKIYKKALEDARAQIMEEMKNQESKESKVDYKSLPISFKKDKFTMTLTQIVKTNANKDSQFYFDVKNKNEVAIFVDAYSARFDYIDSKGNEEQLDLTNVLVNNMSLKALSSLDINFEDSIFLSLSEIPKEVTQGTLSFDIYPVNDSKNVTKVVLPIKLD